MMPIAIIDYGMGNLHSVQKAIEKMGGTAIITNSPLKIINAPAVILPGVGAFQSAMTQLKKLQLDVIIHRVIESGKPFLGICLGMQLLFTKSYEYGEVEGLNVISGEVVKFPDTLKVPHIGWNTIQKTKDQSQKIEDRLFPNPESRVPNTESRFWTEDKGQMSDFGFRILDLGFGEEIKIPLLQDIADNSYFYFVHSYYVQPEDKSVIAATTRYGLEFASMIYKENVYGTQFHPEKSQTIGLKIIKNFLNQIESKV